MPEQDIYALARQLKSFGQGASNAVAGTVAVPIDLLTAMLRKSGMDLEDEQAMGSTAWMKNLGLIQEPENKLAGLIGEGMGMAAPGGLFGKLKR